jgi:hypothetical protein
LRRDSRGSAANQSRRANIATRASLSRTACLLFLTVWLFALASAAQDIPPSGSGWSETERWAWEEIRAGRIADFNTRHGKLDPSKSEGWADWDDLRKLSPDFLKEILFREPYMSALPIEGVRIVGAWFSQPVDLAFGRLERQLWLEGCRFEKAANLMFLDSNDLLSLRSSAFADDVVSVDLTGAKLEGLLQMDAVLVAGTLNMEGLEVGHLFMRGPDASFQDVNLASAKIGGLLNLSSAQVAGTLDMNDVEVGQHLLMRGPDTTFRDVNLAGAKVGGLLDMSSAHIQGELNMTALVVSRKWWKFEEVA